MKLFNDYLRLIVFVSAALIGVQVPGYVDLYGQKLESHVLESEHSISQFQNDADKYFEGDLNLLVNHYKSKKDPIIFDGGGSIASLLERNTMLSSALKDFNKSPLSRYLHSLYQPLTEIQTETVTAYDYSIKLNVSSIIWGITAGFSAAFIIEIVWLLLINLGKFIITKPSSKRQTRRFKKPNQINRHEFSERHFR